MGMDGSEVATRLRELHATATAADSKVFIARTDLRGGILSTDADVNFSRSSRQSWHRWKQTRSK